VCVCVCVCVCVLNSIFTHTCVYNMFIYARAHAHSLFHTHTHLYVHDTHTQTHTQVCETARRAWDFKETRVDDITCLLVFLPPQRAPHPSVSHPGPPHPVPQTYPQYLQVQSDANYGGEVGGGRDGGGYTQAPHYTSVELEPRPAGANSQKLSL
jgi:hypothetical protein